MTVIYQPKGKALEFAPLAFNPYKGCSHGCLYCFAPKATFNDRQNFYSNPEPRKDILNKFKIDVDKITDKTIPITFSFTCDPYQPIESEYKITRQCIEYCNEKDIAVNILTKSSLVKRDFDLLTKNPNHSLGMTLTFLNDKESIEWEPEAVLPSERIDTLYTAFSKDIKTWASIEPVIDPEQSLELIQDTLIFVNHYKIGCLNYDKRANDIDWKDFRKKAEELLKGKSYYITNSLKKRTW